MDHCLISPREAKKMLDNGEAFLIDVRTKEEYEEGHIKGCTLIPLDSVYSTTKLPKDKDKNIIVYCRHGVRSRNFAYILKDMGYQNIYDLGSIYDWPYDLV